MGKDKKELEEQPIEEVPEDTNSDDEVNPADLDLDDINKLEQGDDTEDKDPVDEEPEKKTADVDKPKDDEEPDDRSDFDKEIDVETDVEKLRARLKGLQGVATKKSQEAADLRKQLQESKSKVQELSKSSFEELDAEAEEELKHTDYDAYVEYREAKAQHEQSVKDAEAELIKNVIEVQANEAIEFAKKQFGVDLDLSIDPESQPDAVKALIGENGPLTKIDNYLVENVKAKDDVYTAKQMEDAYKVLFHDQIIADSKKGVREQVVDDIEKAAAGGSKFDRASSDSHTRTGVVKVDDLTHDEIANMSEAECDRILADA